MANGEFIEGLSDSALASIKEFVKEVDKGAKSVEKINELFGKTKLPSGAKPVFDGINDELGKSNKLMTESERLTTKLANARTAEALEVAKLKIELANLTAENKKAAIEALGQLNSYQKLSAQLNTLRTEVKATATDMYLLEQSGKKNSVEYKKLSSTYDENIKKVTQLDAVLKKIDASAGQHQRSVGNYASGFNGLNTSIQQILREAPAAAVSLNTFFLGISNNLPMFFDEITKVNQGLKELKDLASIANSELSSQTALQKASAEASASASEALESQVGNLISSVEASSAQVAAIKEQITAHVGEIAATGEASIATVANTEATLINAGATVEQVAALQSEIVATGSATRVSAEHTLALNAQTAATLEANTAVASSPSLMARLGSSLFSINTLLTVGVLALTLYGGKLIEVISKWLEGATAADAMKQAMEDLDTIRISSIKSVVKEGIELNQNLKIAKNVKISLQEREIAAKKVLDQYPFWFENLGKEAILNGNVQKAVEGVNAALLSRAKSNAAVTKITENQSKIIDLEEERLTVIERITAAESTLRSVQLRSNAASASETAYQTEVNALKTVNDQKENRADLDKEIANLTSINNRLLGYANEESEKAIGLDYKATKEKKAKNLAQKEEIDYLATAYALRKKNNEILIASEESAMNDEEKNFSKRLEAMENYYFQRQVGARMAFDEETRLNEQVFRNQKKQYEKAISEGKAVQETLNQLEYQYQINRQLIRTNFEDQSNQVTIEKAKALRGVLESITDQDQKNLISEKSIEDARQIGLLLSNIGGETTIAGFKKLDQQLKKLSDSEKERNLQAIRIDLARTLAEQDRIKASLLPNEVLSQNQAFIDQKNKELELTKQLTAAENEAATETAANLRVKAEAMAAYIKSFTEGFFGQAGLPTLFKALNKEIEGFGQDFATTFVTVAEIAQEALAFMNQNQQAYFDAQYSRLEKEKDIAIMFAGESASAKEEIEKQFENRSRAIRQREAEAQKQQAIFNAVINTAQAVVGALAKLPDPTAVPLSIAVGIIGAAQIALIAGQQVPQYALGTDNHPGGMAIVGDGGKQELVYQPSSGFSVTPKTDTLVDLEKGSKVFPDFNKILKNSGAMLGGVPNILLESSGASASEIDGIMGKYFANIQTNNTTFDERGFRLSVTKNGNNTVFANKRGSSTGLIT